MSGRREILALLSSSAAALAVGCRAAAQPEPGAGRERSVSSPEKMPVVFVGHGSPMNVIEDNRWSRGFATLSDGLPRPRAILAVSAHWFVPGTFLTANARPRTIHDFGGFPQELYEIEYRAPGQVDLAARVRGMLGEERAGLREDWGLDHGTWSVLRWMYPEADVPVVQLSLDRRLEPRAHLALARSLAPLREDGVLILGSGNITHNLGDAFSRMRSGDHATPAWASGFDRDVAAAVEAHDGDALAALPSTEAGRRAHPSIDHYLPLLYAAAAADSSDAVRFTSGAFDLGSLSMRNVIWS